jgi:hypothetical protein
MGEGRTIGSRQGTFKLNRRKTVVVRLAFMEKSFKDAGAFLQVRSPKSETTRGAVHTARKQMRPRSDIAGDHVGGRTLFPAPGRHELF